MRRAIDLTGQQFGRLTVVSRAQERGKHGEVYWNCVCECGTEKPVRSSSLRYGVTTACGCMNTGERHHMWRGDRVSYYGQHARVSNARGVASAYPCVDCGEEAHAWSYQHDCPGELTQSVNDSRLAYCPHIDCYVARCRVCHKAYDDNPREEEVA